MSAQFERLFYADHRTARDFEGQAGRYMARFSEVRNVEWRLGGKCKTVSFDAPLGEFNAICTADVADQGAAKVAAA